MKKIFSLATICVNSFLYQLWSFVIKSSFAEWYEKKNSKKRLTNSDIWNLRQQMAGLKGIIQFFLIIKPLAIFSLKNRHRFNHGNLSILLFRIILLTKWWLQRYSDEIRLEINRISSRKKIIMNDFFLKWSGRTIELDYFFYWPSAFRSNHNLVFFFLFDDDKLIIILSMNFVLRRRQKGIKWIIFFQIWKIVIEFIGKLEVRNNRNYYENQVLKGL